MTYAAEYELTMRRCYRLGREADRLGREADRLARGTEFERPEPWPVVLVSRERPWSEDELKTEDFLVALRNERREQK